MTMTWESLCVEFRSIFAGLINETNVGHFLINLHPFYRALQEQPRFLTAEDISESNYQRLLAKLLSREIDRLILISESNPGACPVSWRKAVHQDALADRPGLSSAVSDYFNVVLSKARTFPLASAAADRTTDPIIYVSVDAAIRRFEVISLNELLRDWTTDIQRRAIADALRMHLWASAASDETALADLEPVLPFLITAPPIGSDKTEPNNYLVLVR